MDQKLISTVMGVLIYTELLISMLDTERKAASFCLNLLPQWENGNRRAEETGAQVKCSTDRDVCCTQPWVSFERVSFDPLWSLLLRIFYYDFGITDGS